MPKPGKILAVAACIVIACILIYSMFRKKEPVYKGKSLNLWVSQYYASHRGTNRDPQLEIEAEAAIQQMGTNAIAPLLARLSTKDSVLLTNFLRHVPAAWLAKFHLPGLDAYRAKADEYRVSAADGFRLLGMKATPAVPALIALTDDQDKRVRYLTFYTLRCMGPVAKDALPLMIQHLNDGEWIVRDEAVMALGKIQEEPDKVVPILEAVIQSNRSDAILCSDAIQALSLYGEKSASALPLLRSLAKDPNAMISFNAANALIVIAPNDDKTGTNSKANRENQQ